MAGMCPATEGHILRSTRCRGQMLANQLCMMSTFGAHHTRDFLLFFAE
jgi:hypothetical protein